MNELVSTCQKIITSSPLVSLNSSGVEKLALILSEKNFSGSWGDPYPGEEWDKEKRARFFFFMGAINFCYWSDQTPWTFKGQGGAWGLAHCLRERLLDDTLGDLNTWANMSFPTFSALLAGDNQSSLPLMIERWKIIEELGKYLVARWNGQILELLDTHYDAWGLAQLLAANLKGFADVTFWHSLRIPFLKRAQLLAFSLAVNLVNLDFGTLTAMADYKVPQVLRFFNVLKYSPELDAQIQGKILVLPLSEAEVSIRAGAIVGVEAIRIEMEKLGVQKSEAQIDSQLWALGQGAQMQPYHRTLTIWY